MIKKRKEGNLRHPPFFVFCLVSIISGFVLFQYRVKFKSGLVKSSFFLKHQREKLAAIFVIGDYDQAAWHLTLSKKRLAEAEKMLVYHDFASTRLLVLESRKESLLSEQFCREARARGQDIEYIRKDLEQIKERNKEIIRSL